MTSLMLYLSVLPIHVHLPVMLPLRPFDTDRNGTAFSLELCTSETDNVGDRRALTMIKDSRES